jgi:plasmid stabilization system protein ParE
LIGFTAKAQRQIQALRRHYDSLGRTEATRNLIAAMQEAAERIEADPAVGLPAPRPYPELARPRRAWVKAGRYWVLYRTTTPPVVIAVFFETANIPGRL